MVLHEIYQNDTRFLYEERSIKKLMYWYIMTMFIYKKVFVLYILHTNIS